MSSANEKWVNLICFVRNARTHIFKASISLFTKIAHHQCFSVVWCTLIYNCCFNDPTPTEQGACCFCQYSKRGLITDIQKSSTKPHQLKPFNYARQENNHEEKIAALSNYLFALKECVLKRAQNSITYSKPSCT